MQSSELCHLPIFNCVGNDFAFKCGKTFKVTANMSCDVKNLICEMQCSGCEQEYIGETGDSLWHRMTVHRHKIRNANVRILHVSNHYASCAKDYYIKIK